MLLSKAARPSGKRSWKGSETLAAASGPAAAYPIKSLLHKEAALLGRKRDWMINEDMAHYRYQQRSWTIAH